jgi:hypothetical protein
VIKSFTAGTILRYGTFIGYQEGREVSKPNPTIIQKGKIPMNNNKLSITCHPGADHAMGHSFANATVPGVISTNEVPVANTIIVPVEAADISDMDNSTSAAYKICFQKKIASETCNFVDYSKSVKELTDENNGELLASRYGNGKDVNKLYHSCQLCEECDCPESLVNVEYPKLCLFCAHFGYCHDDCLKEKELGVFEPCIDYDCRQFQTDECRSCAVIKDEPEFKFDLQTTSCDYNQSDFPL